MTFNDKILKLQELNPGCKLIFFTKFGSHLYGTDTPNSDQDFKGVYMPSMEMMYLNKVKNTIQTGVDKEHGQKNTSEDIDIQLFSLQYFIELASQGQTVALDMLHANIDSIQYIDPVFNDIMRVRDKFYTKNLKAFVGYARKQAAKYGLKGSRLDAIKNCMNVLAVTEKSSKLWQVWEQLPIGEHSRFIEDNPQGLGQYEICGKILQETMGCDYAYNFLEKYYKSYGARAIQAQNNEGVDFKAISHALRAAYQVRSIYVDGTITFPLKQAEYLRNVKLGKFHYANEVAPVLEEMIEEVEYISCRSDLPEKVSKEFTDKLIIDSVLKFYNLGV